MNKPDRLLPMMIAGALIIVFAATIMDGTNPIVMFKPAPMLLIFGGSILASVAGIMRSDIKAVKAAGKKVMKAEHVDPQKDLDTIVHLAEVARREGLLALEKAASEVEDPFFKKGIEMTVDGVDPEEIREILEGEIDSLEDRHKLGTQFFSDLGGFSPTLGIIGTVIGLVAVLGSLTNPGQLGPKIASAFTATLWGILMANLVWLPISNKLKRASSLELMSRRLILDGILAIQAGSSPRMVQARLQCYIAPKNRADVRGTSKQEEAA
ncbi:MAG: motility protein A [Acidimicrobiales bacterium]